jgi:hypothetical protein
LGKGVRHQYCQFHYVGNVARKLDPDLKTLGEEVRKTDSDLRGFQRDLLRIETAAKEAEESVPADLPIALELCQAAHAEARRHARAPYQPPAWKRHEGLERVAETVARARQKKGGPGRT